MSILNIADPPIKNYLANAHPLSIIGTATNYKLWLYSNFTDLHIPDDPEIPIDFHHNNDIYSDVLAVEKVPIEQLYNREVDIIQFVVENIHLGKYVRLGVNEFFIPGTPAYMDRNYDHPLLIFGYSKETNMFLAKMFYENIYMTKEIPFHIVKHAFLNLTLKRDYLKHITLYQLKDRDFSFDRIKFFKYLNQYLNPDISMSSNRKARGILVYDFVIDYFKTTKPRYDIRILQTMMEHKILMEERIMYLHGIGIIGSSICKDFVEISNTMTACRNILLKYRFSRHSNLLKQIEEYLTKLMDKETESCKALIPHIL